MSDFGDRVLGKGIVYCKDTPNFIANRIGIFSMMYAMKVMEEDGYTIDELDRIGGPALGRPKSAYFRTADLVGLDTLVHVAKNIYDNVSDDPQKDVFIAPDFVQKMVENKWLCNFWRVQIFKNGTVESGFELNLKSRKVEDYWVPQRLVLQLQKAGIDNTLFIRDYKFRNILLNKDLQILK